MKLLPPVSLMAGLTQLWTVFYRWCSRWIDAGFQALGGKEPQLDGDFDVNADWAIAEQTPKGARIVVWLSVAAVAVLILWAAVAVLDEVTRGEGKVIPSRQKKSSSDQPANARPRLQRQGGVPA